MGKPPWLNWAVVTPFPPLNTMTTEKISQIKYLRDECDHLFMSYTFVTEINALFGTRLVPHYSIPHDIMGMYATTLAEKLCEAFAVHYDPKMGHDSALRECCNKLLVHFENDEREDVPLK
jgi:hypothetical protein